MKFSGPNSKLEIAIVSGPDAEGWFKLCVSIECDSGSWQSPSDPCIMASELRALEGFFDADEDQVVNREIEFLEPELAFTWREGKLTAVFSYALCPPWADAAEGFGISFPANVAAMQKAKSYIATRNQTTRGRSHLT